MLEILRFEFMQNALLAGLILGFIAPLVGVHLVVRRLSMMSEGLSHVTLSGVAAGLILKNGVSGFSSFNPLYMGMAFSLASSLFMEKLRRLYSNYQEIAIPILLSGGISLGVVLISAARGLNVDIINYLFGNIMGVSRTDLLFIFIIGCLVVLFLSIFYKELFSISFDEEYAVLSGVSYRVLNFIFMIMVALVISAALNIVGILLVSALMTIPVATSLKLTNSFGQALALSVLFAQISVFGGLISSYYFDLASGGMIVLCSILILLVVLALKSISLKLRKV